MGRSEDLRRLAEPVVAAAGLELWDVEVGSDLVRILVDRPAGADSEAADLDAVAEAARRLSTLLDEHDDVAPAGHYELEVSSPGVERVLRTPEHYRRYVGATVAIKLAAPRAGTRRLRGVLTEAGEEGITLSPDEPAGQPLDLAYPDIQRAHLVMVWPEPADRARARPRARAPRPAASARRGARTPDPKDA